MFEKFASVKEAAKKLEGEDCELDAPLPLGNALKDLANARSELHTALRQLSSEDLAELTGIVWFGERAAGLHGDAVNEMLKFIADARKARQYQDAGVGHIADRRIAANLDSAEYALKYGLPKLARNEEELEEASDEN